MYDLSLCKIIAFLTDCFCNLLALKANQHHTQHTQRVILKHSANNRLIDRQEMNQ